MRKACKPTCSQRAHSQHTPVHRPTHPFAWQWHVQGPIFAEWFKGGKTNIAYNCLDRHVKEGFGDQVGRAGGKGRGGVPSTALKTALKLDGHVKEGYGDQV